MDGYADARTFFSPFTGLSWWIALAISEVHLMPWQTIPFSLMADFLI